MKPAALYAIETAVFILAGALAFLAYRYLGSMKILMYVLIGIFAAAAVIFGAVALPLYFRRTVIYLSSDDISINTGIFFYRREHMKLSAVQYLTSVTFPLGGLLGFNFIIAHGLGGNMILPFLSKKDFDEIFLQIDSRGENGSRAEE